MGKIIKYRKINGFALPAVLIASIVMLTVLLVAVSSTTAVQVALVSQYYNQLSRSAADAGLSYADSCLDLNNGTPLWSDAKPLTQNTDCSGNQIAGFTCSTGSVDPRCSVSSSMNDSGTSHSVKVLVVGGGGGGANTGGGGGAGGYVYQPSFTVASNLYSVVIGSGGVGGGPTGNPVKGGKGGNSVFSTITAEGGGYGASHGGSVGGNGGSGGGGGVNASGVPPAGGTGSQGHAGGIGYIDSGWIGTSGGGGGAGTAGTPGGYYSGAGNGGAGLSNDISGTSSYYAGGGGAGLVNGSTYYGVGGLGGGGNGSATSIGANGIANTGGGGGGGSYAPTAFYHNGGSGGSGIVIISYPTGSMNATGGTVTISGGNTIHTFTGSGTFTVLPVANAINLLVVGGGGGGGSGGTSGGGGGGGAGGLLTSTNYAVSAGNTAITIGNGGGGGSNGGNSAFGSLIAYGGGHGGVGAGAAGAAGGSGGGGNAVSGGGGLGTSGQGYRGGNVGALSQGDNGSAGGGGAAGQGVDATWTNRGTTGGSGLALNISGSSVTYAVGGAGGDGPYWGTGQVGATGAANKGNGGGGAGYNGTSGAGGSGVVIISYPTGSLSATGGTITTSGGNTIHTFTSSGTFTVSSTISGTNSGFSVGLPDLDTNGKSAVIRSIGTVSLLKKSDNTVWRTYSQASSMATSYPGTIASGGLVLNLDPGNQNSYPDGGTSWLDLSNYGNNGSLINGVGYVNNNNGVLNFNGINNYASIPNSSSLQVTGDLTLEFWVNPANLAKSRQNIINKAFGGEYTVTQEQNGVMDYYYGISGTDGGTYTGFSAGSVIQGKWTCVTITRDLVNQMMYGYINGALANSTPSLAYNYATASANAVSIGTGYAGSYSGMIGAIHIYNRDLSAAEIKQNYNALKGRYQ
jgi:hypothetical protein